MHRARDAEHTPIEVTIVILEQAIAALKKMPQTIGLARGAIGTSHPIILPTVGNPVNATGQKPHQDLEELAPRPHVSHLLREALDLRPAEQSSSTLRKMLMMDRLHRIHQDAHGLQLPRLTCSPC